MRVLILNPPFDLPISRASRGPAVGRGGTFFYPFWLAYAAGVVEEDGNEVRLVDAIARHQTRADVVQLVREFQPRLVIMDVTAPTLSRDIVTASAIREVSDAYILGVGPHATVQIDDVLAKDTAFDGVARGEYDYTVRDLARALDGGSELAEVDGLTWRSDEKLIHNSNRELIANLDELPFVSSVYKKHLCITDYFYSANLYPEVAILSGRGCPYRCYWCLFPQTMTGHKYRGRSPENFVDELEWIGRNLPEVREVFIEDDTFTADAQRVDEICNLIRKRRLRVTWACNVRPDLSRETLSTMKSAGCRMLLAGFESGSQSVLNAMKKGLKRDRAFKFVRDAKSVGIVVHGCFTAGGEGETKETLQETLQYAIDLDPTTAQFCPIMVYPGTEAYEWAKRNNYLASTNFDEWITDEGTHNCQVSTPELPAHELTQFCDHARRRFYVRPSYMIRAALWALPRPREWKRMARGFISLSRFLIRFG